MPRGRPKAQTHTVEMSNGPNLKVVVTETKHEKFRRLANQRGKQLISYMKSVGRLGGPSYESTPDEIERLVTRLQREFDFMLEQLRHGTTEEDTDLI